MIKNVSNYKNNKNKTLWETLSELKNKLDIYPKDVKKIYYQNWFLHYTMNEIKKEFLMSITYDKPLRHYKIFQEYMLIYFKYNILDTNNPRDIPKIVRNISYKYNLTIQGLEDYEINGHFNQKGQYDFSG